MNELILLIDGVKKTCKRMRGGVSEQITLDLFASRESGRHIHENCELRAQHGRIINKGEEMGRSPYVKKTDVVTRRTLFALEIYARACSGNLLDENNEIRTCVYREDCMLYKTAR